MTTYCPAGHPQQLLLLNETEFLDTDTEIVGLVTAMGREHIYPEASCQDACGPQGALGPRRVWLKFLTSETAEAFVLLAAGPIGTRLYARATSAARSPGIVCHYVRDEAWHYDVSLIDDTQYAQGSEYPWLDLQVSVWFPFSDVEQVIRNLDGYQQRCATLDAQHNGPNAPS